VRCVTPRIHHHGYLLRRPVAADFESVSFAAVGWIPVLVSAAAYSLLDGPLWPTGMAPGLVFAMLLIRMGKGCRCQCVALCRGAPLASLRL